jgi:hypothetical protein
MSMHIWARMAMMQMHMWKKNHRKLMMDQPSARRVEDAGHSKCDLGTSNIRGYQCEDGGNADANAEGKASQADDQSTPNVED